MEASVSSVLAEVNQALRLHAGGIELVEEDQAAGQVRVRFSGMCAHCPLSEITLKATVKKALCAECPWVREVIRVD